MSAVVPDQIWLSIKNVLLLELAGGGRGIRTPGTVSRTAVFKTACFNRSHIPPREERVYFHHCTTATFEPETGSVA